MEEQRGIDRIEKKATRCCDVQPEKSTKNKPGEKPGEYHYRCPVCGKDPAMIRIIGG